MHIKSIEINYGDGPVVIKTDDEYIYLKRGSGTSFSLNHDEVRDLFHIARFVGVELPK